ncbi:MAG: DUF4430 domain-containing protein [Firmicutes bacterium]|nr:DUF4430 domain-containing protein [Bacillota bacterium]MBQ5797576.1 DUF4430 domain-containing protein [Bacillota bacterium]
MKQHRLLAILLILLLMLSCLFTGCGGSAESEIPASDPQGNQQVEQMEQLDQAEKTEQTEQIEQDVTLPEEGQNDEAGDVNYSETQGMEIDPETGKDQYLTDPVPEGKPIPVEPQHAVVTDKQMTCTLTITCKTILDNMDDLDPEKIELVPEDGVILAEKTVTFYEGENVFQLLRREAKANKIHMEFEETPIYNSAYIEGIHNLYEFDCGELSGWMYSVNGWYPNYGCSRYQLKEGDQVEWIYTCDLGRDIGGRNVFD